MKIVNAQTIKLATPPTGNPPAGTVYQWHTLDGATGATNLAINYRSPTGTNLTVSSANIIATGRTMVALVL